MSKRGFTLIEVLTVVAIIGILASLTSYVYGSALTRSRDNTRKSDLLTIKNSLEQFYLENREYPKTKLETTAQQETLSAKYQLESINGCNYGNNPNTINSFIAPKYLSSVPTDPKVSVTYDASCHATPPTLNGKYLYLPLAVNRDDLVNKYYLAAKMEIQKNASSSVPAELVEGTSSYARTISGLYTLGKAVTCTVGSPDPTCTHNYFLSNK